MRLGKRRPWLSHGDSNLKGKKRNFPREISSLNFFKHNVHAKWKPVVNLIWPFCKIPLPHSFWGRPPIIMNLRPFLSVAESSTLALILSSVVRIYTKLSEFKPAARLNDIDE